jgi:hypothetical protein
MEGETGVRHLQVKEHKDGCIQPQLETGTYCSSFQAPEETNPNNLQISEFYFPQL